MAAPRQLGRTTGRSGTTGPWKARAGTLAAVVLAGLAVAGPAAAEEDALVTPQEAAAEIAGVFPAAFAPPPAGLGLTESGDGFTTGGSQPLQVSASLEDGVALQTDGGTIRITPFSEGGAPSEGELVDGAGVVYANTAPSSDTAVRATADGVETFTGIRASEAPEAFSFRVDLAAGERLTELAGGGVAVVRDGEPTEPGEIAHRAPDGDPGPPDADDPTLEPGFEALAEDEPAAAPSSPVVEGEVVAEIAPTWAQDADGNPVATNLEVAGDVVTLEVEHRGDETAYPVVADPVVTTPAKPATTSTSAGTTLPTWRSVYDWPAGNGYFTWDTATSATDAGAYSFARGLAAGPGLWLWPTGGRTYQPGFAEWNYTAPGSTRLLKSSIELAYNPRILSHHCVRAVLRGPEGERTSSTFCKPPAPPKGNPAVVTLPLSDPTPGSPTSTQTAIRLELPCTKSNTAACAKNIPAADATQNGIQIRRVDMTLTDTDLPVLAPAGEFYDLRDSYINGKAKHPLTLAASDGGSGVQRVAVEEVGVREIGSATAPCDPTHKTAALGTRICPASFTAPTSVDATQLNEGRHLFRETARDLAGNLGASQPWTVFVDRTPPAWPTSLGVEAVLDEDVNEIDVSWNGAADPVLSDGTQPAGTWTYRFRVRRGSGSWSTWTDTNYAGASLPQGFVGEVLSVEVQPVDRAGNIGAVLGGTDTTALTTATAGDNMPPEEEPDSEEASSRNAFSTAASYTETLCPDGSPCGTFRAKDAAAYADRWWNRRNPEFDSFNGEGGDCTNFVSQALRAGGFRFMRATKNNDPSDYDREPGEFREGEGAWWSGYTTDVSNGKVLKRHKVVPNFVRVEDSRSHFRRYGLVRLVRRVERPKVGDVIYLKLQGRSKGWTHAVIVVRVTKGDYFVAQHTTDRRIRWSDYAKIVRDQRGEDWAAETRRPVHTAANIR